MSPDGTLPGLVDDGGRVLLGWGSRRSVLSCVAKVCQIGT